MTEHMVATHMLHIPDFSNTRNGLVPFTFTRHSVSFTSKKTLYRNIKYLFYIMKNYMKIGLLELNSRLIHNFTLFHMQWHWLVFLLMTKITSLLSAKGYYYTVVVYYCHDEVNTLFRIVFCTTTVIDSSYLFTVYHYTDQAYE